MLEMNVRPIWFAKSQLGPDVRFFVLLISSSFLLVAGSF